MIRSMFRGSFNPKWCVNSLFVPQYLRKTHHGLGIYQYHKDSLYSRIQHFASPTLSGSAKGIGSNVVKSRLRKHEYIHGRRTRARKEQRQVVNYWKGDWPTFGGVMRIIGTYDATNAKTANLGTSSITRSG